LSEGARPAVGKRRAIHEIKESEDRLWLIIDALPTLA
jgi:hypothetical protein